MAASTMPLRTTITTAAPTPALPVPTATLPEARFSLSAESLALMPTLPPACTVAKSSI